MIPLLEVKNLHISLVSMQQYIHIVRGISYTIYPGEIVGVMGESGCGKSCAFKSLLRLNDPSSHLTGEIRFQNKNLLEASESEMQDVRKNEFSFISQEPMNALNPTMKVGKQIQEAYFKCFPQNTLNDFTYLYNALLSDLGFDSPQETFHAYPYMLSGGMCQRILIAISLIKKPKLIVADEPTTALDENIKQKILLDLRKNLIKNHSSMIFISHDLNSLYQFCDRVMVMYAGKIIEIAATEELFFNSQHPYTQALLACRLDKEMCPSKPLNFIPYSPPNLKNPINYCAFCPRCPEAMTICAQTIPPLYQFSTQHKSACFKLDERNKP